MVYKTLLSVTNGYRYEQNVIVIYTRLSLLRRKKSGFTKDCRPSSNGNRLLAKDCWLSTKGYLPFTKRSSGIDQSFALLAKGYRLSTKGYPYFQEVIGYQQTCIRYQQLWRSTRGHRYEQTVSNMNKKVILTTETIVSDGRYGY